MNASILKPNSLRNQAGITFIETVIASAILALVLISVLSLASESFRYLADIRDRARSSQVLQQPMDNIRLKSWTAMQSLPTTFSDPSDTNGTYAGSISVSDYDSYSSTTTVKRVTLTVTWTNRVGKVSTNTLTTLIANGGLNK